MFEELKLTEAQQDELNAQGSLLLELDEALMLLKPYDIGVTSIANALGMGRSNVRTQFSRGCKIELFPASGEIKMIRVEEELKSGQL